jgi:phenylacetate-CoA ligase
MNLFTSLLENLLLPLGDRVLGATFIASLKSWRKTLSGSASQLENLQRQKLKDLLNHATKNSPFYELQHIPESRDPYIWLKSYPILSKKSFKHNLQYILTKPIDQNITSVMSSGSTGPPSQVYFSKTELSNNRALQIIWWEWAGYRFGNSLLQTGVNMKRSKEKLIKDKLLRTRYIDAMSHSEAQILNELKLLRSNPRQHFVAYASSLYLFAKTALAHNIRDVKFQSVISLGEKLLPQFREAIETAFSCKVYDTYGASEGFLIASQCSEGRYHIMTPHVVVEILDEKNHEVQPGQTGRVVLTGLDNFTTPLIRYEVGDLAVKGHPVKCNCGLELPVLGEIIGRLTEFLLTPSGKFITVQTVVRVLKQFPEIEQFKVIQLDADLYKLIYISPKSQSDSMEKRVKEMFEDVFGEPLRFEFEKVRELPKAKTGKFQLIENQYTSI